jgi:uncharacterized protein YdhG (YjbR/CyaY superfamily)
MNDIPTTYQSIDDYITGFPDKVQAILRQIRQLVRDLAPEAEEGISYQMPTFKLHGPLVYFGAYKSHIGFYPTPSGTEKFQEELAPYKSGKGSIRFPLDQPIPFDLIAEIVKFRVQENLEKAEGISKKL